MSAPERGHIRSQTMPVAPTIPQITKLNEENTDSDARCAVCHNICVRAFACISKHGYEIMLCSNRCMQNYVVTNMTHATKCERVRVKDSRSQPLVVRPIPIRPTVQEPNGSQHIDLSKRASTLTSQKENQKKE